MAMRAHLIALIVALALPASAFAQTTYYAGPFNGSGSGGQSGTYCLGSYNFTAVAGHTYTVSTTASGSGDTYLKVTGVCSCANDDYSGLLSQCACTAASTGVATICASTYSTAAATWSYTVTEPTQAGQPSGDFTVASCGSTQAYWNAPKGAAVFSRAPGPIAGVIDQIGEYRTHVVLSHGNTANAWVSQNSLAQPGRTSDTCSACKNPLKGERLLHGYPGGNQTTQSAMYTYYYADPPTAPVFLQWQNADPNNEAVLGKPTLGEKIVDYGEGCLPKEATYTVANQNVINRYLWPPDEVVNHASPYFEYRLYEYYTGQNGPGINMAGTCSMFLGYLQKKAFGPGWEVANKQYDVTQTWNALVALHDRVQSECKQQQGWFRYVANVVCDLGCWTWGDVCDHAGNQVGNCMVGDINSPNCYGGNYDITYPSQGAVSLSPDRLGGWTNQTKLSPVYSKTNGIVTGTNGWSVWAYDGNHSVAWSAGGNTYTCWY
jgi:hypothetical protein